MLWKKMFRDVLESRGQFLSIFLLVCLGVLIFTGLNAIGYGMKESSEEFYQNTRLADAFCYGDSFTQETIERLKQIGDIEKVEGRRQVTCSTVDDASTVLQINWISTNELSQMQVVEGEGYTYEKDGIWLDAQYCEANGLTIGDTISYSNQGRIETKKIVAKIMHPEYVFARKDESEALPDHKSFGFGFVSSKYDTLLESQSTWNQLLIQTTLDKEQLMEKIAAVIPSNQMVIVMQKELGSVDMFSNEIAQMMAVQTVFPVIFFVVAFLTILTTMTRITVNQRQQIGIIKALGFPNRTILLHYTSFGLCISLLGAVVGAILGITFLPELTFEFQKTMYTLPKWTKEVESYIFSVVLLAVLLCGLCGFMACKKQLRGVAAEVLRPKSNTRKVRRVRNVRRDRKENRGWFRLSFDVQWNIRDCIRNKLRVFITVFGIIGCMALILCGLGMKNTVEELIKEHYYELNTYQTKVNLSEKRNLDLVKELEKDNRNQFIMEGTTEIRYKGESKATALTVVGEGEYSKYKEIDGTVRGRSKTGIYMTQKLAKELGIDVGQQVILQVSGGSNPVSVEVEAIIRNPVGQGIFLSQEVFEKLGQTFEPNSFVTSQSGQTWNEMEGIKLVRSKSEMIATMDELLTMMNTMIAIMIFAAVLLGIIVLYNLGILTFYERTRELATLKVLGFQYKRLATLTQMQTIWLTIIGVILGIPAGYVVLSYMILFIGDAYDMKAVISMQSYVVSCVGTMVLSLAVNWALSRKLKSVDMVSALKSIE